MGERRHAITVRGGQTYRAQFILKGVDLTGCRAVLRVLPSSNGVPTSSTPLLTYDSASNWQISVANTSVAMVVDAITIPVASGVVTLEIPVAAVNALAEGTHVYSVRIYWPVVSGIDQRITPVCSGPFIRLPAL